MNEQKEEQINTTGDDYEFYRVSRHTDVVFAFPNHWKVAEIGCGDKPDNWHPRANLLMDILPEEKIPKEGLEKHGAEYVSTSITDMSKIPDKSIDFLFCNHLLEHIDDIGKALSELVRVAKRGYIECPTKFAETMFGWPDGHVWVIESDGECLIIERNKVLQPFGNYFHNLLEHEEKFQGYYWKNQRLFFNGLFWKDKISIKVIDGLEVTTKEEVKDGD